MIARHHEEPTEVFNREFKGRPGVWVLYMLRCRDRAVANCV